MDRKATTDPQINYSDFVLDGDWAEADLLDLNLFPAIESSPVHSVPAMNLYSECLMNMERSQQSAAEQMQDFVMQLKDKLGVRDVDLVPLRKQKVLSSPDSYNKAVDDDDDDDDVLYELEFEQAGPKRTRWTQITISLSLGYILYADRSADNKGKRPAFSEPIAHEEQWALEHGMPYRDHVICPSPSCQRMLDSRVVRLPKSQLPSTSANPIMADDLGDITSDCCQCPVCGLHFCYQCRQPWHRDVPCSQVRRFKWDIDRVPRV